MRVDPDQTQQKHENTLFDSSITCKRIASSASVYSASTTTRAHLAPKRRCRRFFPPRGLALILIVKLSTFTARVFCAWLRTLDGGFRAGHGFLQAVDSRLRRRGG